MTVFVNAIMYYRVKDQISAVANVDDYSGSARLLAATILRNVLGTRNLGDILSDRESIALEMQVKFRSLSKKKDKNCQTFQVPEMKILMSKPSNFSLRWK